MRRNVHQRQRKMAQHAKARCGKTGKPFLHSWNCPGCGPHSFPALRGKTSSGAPCRSRRQLPSTRQFPPRAAQQPTTCQLCLSTPCNWNQAYRHNFLAGCIVNFMRTGASDLSMRECHRNPLRTLLHTPRSPTSSGTPCRNRRHHTPAPRHAPRCLTM